MAPKITIFEHKQNHSFTWKKSLENVVFNAPSKVIQRKFYAMPHFHPSQQKTFFFIKDGKVALASMWLDFWSSIYHLKFYVCHTDSKYECTIYDKKCNSSTFFTTYPASKVHIFRHNCYTVGMKSTQISILKKTNQITPFVKVQIIIQSSYMLGNMCAIIEIRPNTSNKP